MSSPIAFSAASLNPTNRLAGMAALYCHLIDDFNGFHQDRAWLPQMRCLLSCLHATVMDFNPSVAQGRRYCLPDDDQRCELYLHLRDIMDSQAVMQTEKIEEQLSDYLADDFTDMYFDLKTGLEMYANDPQQAIRTWLNSFYQHWGIHLLDAENHLLEVQRKEKR